MTKTHINEYGVFVPNEKANFPENPEAHIVEKKIIHPVDIENEYPFLDKSFGGRWLNFWIYAGIFLLVYPVHRIYYGLKIVGKENIKKNKSLFKNGAMTICNHVYRWDFLAVVQAVGYKRIWFPCLDKNVMTSDWKMVRGAGGIPIPSTNAATRQFNKAFDELHKNKKWIHVFPENSRWDFYQPIRPFKIGAFKMAYRYKIPVIPMVISYRKPKGIYKLLKIKHPLITISVGKPVLPEKQNEESKNETCLRMLTDSHLQMQKMAGIKQNGWEVFSE